MVGRTERKGATAVIKVHNMTKIDLKIGDVFTIQGINYRPETLKEKLLVFLKIRKPRIRKFKVISTV